MKAVRNFNFGNKVAQICFTGLNSASYFSSYDKLKKTLLMTVKVTRTSLIWHKMMLVSGIVYLMLTVTLSL